MQALADPSKCLQDDEVDGVLHDPRMEMEQRQPHAVTPNHVRPRQTGRNRFQPILLFMLMDSDDEKNLLFIYLFIYTKE